MAKAATTKFDPYMTAIIANRIDGIIREMTNTLLRAARSAVINSARDFSCAVCTFFIKPHACKVVDGAVSLTGWCKLFDMVD